MKSFIKTSTLLVILTLFFSCNTSEKKEEKVTKKPNILFLAIDDLRPE